MPGWMRHRKAYVPGAALTMTMNGPAGGPLSGAPELTTADPSNEHGLAALPHANEVGRTAAKSMPTWDVPLGLAVVSSSVVAMAFLRRSALVDTPSDSIAWYL